MDKLEMAHEYAMKCIGNPNVSVKTDNEIIAFAWQYADTMQAEADKRNYSEKQDSSEWQPDSVPTEILKHDAWRKSWQRENIKPSLEWQPDWSQAPNDAKYWAMDKDSSANFFRNKPEITNGNGWDFGGVMQSNNVHKYTGNWQDSLRKRPQ